MYVESEYSSTPSKQRTLASSTQINNTTKVNSNVNTKPNASSSRPIFKVFHAFRRTFPSQRINHHHKMDHHEKIEFGKEKEQLKELLGKLEKPQQIANAVHYEASLRNSDQDYDKRQVLSNYLSTELNGLHARAEMQIYRMMGKTSKYFVQDQVLDCDTLRQLVAALEFWVFLALEGDLGPLLEHKDVKRVYESNGSAAEVFRAFLRMQKRNRGNRPWTHNHMSQVVFSVHEAVEAFENRNQKANSVGKSLHGSGLARTSQVDREAEGPPTKKARKEEMNNVAGQATNGLGNLPKLEPRPSQPSKELQHSFVDVPKEPTYQKEQETCEGFVPTKPPMTNLPEKKPALTIDEKVKNSSPRLASLVLTRKVAFENHLQSTHVHLVQKLKGSSQENISQYGQYETTKEPLQQTSTSSKLKRPHDNDTAKAQPLQPSKSEPLARKFTGDIWEVSGDESDVPERKAVGKEVRLSAADVLSACVIQIAKALTRKQKTTEVAVSNSNGGDTWQNCRRPEPVHSSVSSAHETPRESTPVQRLSASLPKFEAKFSAVERAHADAKSILKTAKERAAEANMSLAGFGTKARTGLEEILLLNPKAGEDWTWNGLRTQAEAFRNFGFDKRRQLLAVQVPILEEEETRKKFEEAKTEYEKWKKKMELLNQAAEAFDED